MAIFQYQVRDGQGMSANGTIAAPTVEDAGRMLRAEGKFIIKLFLAPDAASSGAAAAAKSEAPASRNDKRVRRIDVIMFAHEVAVMVETGVPLSEALDTAAVQAMHPGFRTVLKEVAAYVQGGGEFSAALRKYPHVFPPLMASLIRASEISGTMGLMLDRIARYMSKEHQILKQARGALMYPLFMMCMALGVTIFLLTFVMPKFAKIYEARHAVLPLPTRMLIGFSNTLADYWYLWLALTLVAGVGGFFLARTPTGRRIVDYLKLNIPVVRKVYTQLYLSRACRTLGTMIAAGVHLMETIPILKRVTQNVYYDVLWDAVNLRLEQGSQLSEPLFASKLIPRSIAQMIYCGEKSGRLGQVMTRIADFAEEEFDQAIKVATQFLEPVMIAVMGAIIGFVAISLLLPIFSVSKVVAGGH